MDLGAIMAGPHRFAEVVGRTARWYDLVLAVSTPHPPAFTRQRAASLIGLAGSPTPIVNLWLSGDLGDEGLAMLRASGVPVVTEPRAAVRAISGLGRLASLRRDDAEQHWEPTTTSPTLQRLPGGSSPSEADAKALLAEWGMPVVEGTVVADRDAAIAEAARLGYPVVVKVSAANLEHKTEAGGVRLDLRTPAEVGAAVDDVVHNVARHAPVARIDGILVEQFTPGLEMIVGVRHDPVFGPIVLVGLGGVLAEALDDVVVAPAPVTERGVRRMLDRLRAGAVLQSSRRRPAPDLAALAGIVAAFSRRFCGAGDVAEAEMNPLVFGARGWLAVDAVVRLR